MKLNQTGKIIKVYPIGILKDKGSFVDLFEVLPNKKWNLICTICDLTDKEALCDDELKIKKECVVWDEDDYPDIYVNQAIGVRATQRCLRMLKKETKLKYKLINENLVDSL